MNLLHGATHDHTRTQCNMPMSNSSLEVSVIKAMPLYDNTLLKADGTPDFCCETLMQQKSRNKSLVCHQAKMVDTIETEREKVYSPQYNKCVALNDSNKTKWRVARKRHKAHLSWPPTLIL